MAPLFKRHILTFAVALVTAAVTVAAPAMAAKSLTKKKALKLFYGKAESDARYVTPGLLQTGDGAINQAADPVHWTRLQGVPASFADGDDDVGPVGWELNGNSGTISGTNFLGTTDNVALDLRVNSARALRLEPNPTSPNVIAGSSANSVTGGALGAAIGGGGDTTLPNQVTDDYGVIGGGYSNQAGDDAGSTADAQYTTVSGGLGNAAKGPQATVSGGNSNFANGLSSSVGGGEENLATGAYASVPGGFSGSAAQYGQLAHAAGAFTFFGDAQAAEFVLRRETTDATPSELFLDGAALRMNIETGNGKSFRALIVGRTSAGTTAGYLITGLIERTGAATAMVGSPAVTVLGEEDSAWNAAASADNTNDALVLTVTGAAATTIHWVAVVNTAEVDW